MNHNKIIIAFFCWLSLFIAETNAKPKIVLENASGLPMRYFSMTFLSKHDQGETKYLEVTFANIKENSRQELILEDGVSRYEIRSIAWHDVVYGARHQGFTEGELVIITPTTISLHQTRRLGAEYNLKPATVTGSLVAEKSFLWPVVWLDIGSDFQRGAEVRFDAQQILLAAGLSVGGEYPKSLTIEKERILWRRQFRHGFVFGWVAGQKAKVIPGYLLEHLYPDRKREIYSFAFEPETSSQDVASLMQIARDGVESGYELAMRLREAAKIRDNP